MCTHHPHSAHAAEILSIGSDQHIDNGKSYSLQEFVSFYERLAHYQVGQARGALRQWFSVSVPAVESESTATNRACNCKSCSFGLDTASGPSHSHQQGSADSCCPFLFLCPLSQTQQSIVNNQFTFSQPGPQGGGKQNVGMAPD